MKKIVLAVSVPLFVAWSGLCVSDTCYIVKGEVKTVNISATNQSGHIDLLLLDEHGNEAFRETGNLVGTITGGDFGETFLSHNVSFDDGSNFITSNDVATVVDIRKLAEDGVPCSFFMHEVITNIEGGSGFFGNVKEVEIHADGYVSACFAGGENENEFELTGTLCVNER